MLCWKNLWLDNNRCLIILIFQPFKYDTHQVKCYEVPPPHHEKSQNISCVCRDIPSNRMKQCNGISNLEQVCETTLATFLQLMVYENIYRLPCDANNMTAPCWVALTFHVSCAFMGRLRLSTRLLSMRSSLKVFYNMKMLIVCFFSLPKFALRESSLIFKGSNLISQVWMNSVAWITLFHCWLV